MLISRLRINGARACLVLAAALPLCAHAGILDDDEARMAILALRSRLDKLALDVQGRIDDKADRRSVKDMQTRHERSLADIAAVRDQLAVVSNELVSVQQRQQALYADLDARLGKLEPRLAMVEGRETPVRQHEQLQFDAAMGLFKGAAYRDAASALEAFVGSYPSSPYAASAQYWLGNAYYAQRDCPNAIRAQQGLAELYPFSVHAPDAMLNAATCHAELKDKKRATKVFRELIDRYADSPAARTARARIKAMQPRRR
jgi:tol-pal system protein YbgF